jgi:DNA-binding IscR family transcriptional regulator
MQTIQIYEKFYCLGGKFMNSDFTLAIHSLSYLALQSDRMSTASQLRVNCEAISESAGVHPVRIRKVLSLLKKHGIIKSK